MLENIYETAKIILMDNTIIEVSPLKIKYFREFMETFDLMEKVENDDEALMLMLECGRICMQQFCPEMSTSFQIFEDNIDLNNLYILMEIAGGIKINPKTNMEDQKHKNERKEKNSSLEELDLVKLEVEAFLLGKWKNFEDLEKSLSLPELIKIVSSQRELSYEERKFVAAIQGIDIEKNSDRGQKEWEDMKARVFSKGKAIDSNDILALQGETAKKAGFGINMGLDYQDLRDPSIMKS